MSTVTVTPVKILTPTEIDWLMDKPFWGARSTVQTKLNKLMDSSERLFSVLVELERGPKTDKTQKLIDDTIAKTKTIYAQQIKNEERLLAIKEQIQATLRHMCDGDPNETYVYDSHTKSISKLEKPELPVILPVNRRDRLKSRT